VSYDTSGFSGSAMDELLRQAKGEGLMRGLMDTSGFSGSAMDELLRQAKGEGLMRGLMGTSGYSGSAMDEVLREAKSPEKTDETDSLDMERKINNINLYYVLPKSYKLKKACLYSIPIVILKTTSLQII